MMGLGLSWKKNRDCFKEVIRFLCKQLDRIRFFNLFSERSSLEVREWTVKLGKLPSTFSGLRIAHFSDVHLDHYLEEKDIKRLIDMLKRLQPDMICFTGDLVDQDTASLAEALPYLAELDAPLGKYAVLGNHDYRSGAGVVARGLKECGFTVLSNQYICLQRGSDLLFVVGVDDMLHGKPDLPSAMHGVPADACSILLVHEPDAADEAAAYPLSLQLSGHSHGGQICLPVIGHILTTEMGRKYPHSLVQVKGSDLQVHTSRGVGTTLIPIRFFCRPEISLLTLERND